MDRASPGDASWPVTLRHAGGSVCLYLANLPTGSLEEAAVQLRDAAPSAGWPVLSDLTAGSPDGRPCHARVPVLSSPGWVRACFDVNRRTCPSPRPIGSPSSKTRLGPPRPGESAQSRPDDVHGCSPSGRHLRGTPAGAVGDDRRNRGQAGNFRGKGSGRSGTSVGTWAGDGKGRGRALPRGGAADRVAGNRRASCTSGLSATALRPAPSSRAQGERSPGGRPWFSPRTFRLTGTGNPR